MELKKRLGKIILLSILFLSIAHSSNAEQLPNKPFKVCPEIVTAKDTPCRVLGPTVAVVQRMEKPNEDKQKIKELEEKVKALEAQIRELQTR